MTPNVVTETRCHYTTQTKPNIQILHLTKVNVREKSSDPKFVSDHWRCLQECDHYDVVDNVT